MAENKLSSQGTLLTRYPGKLTCFLGLGGGEWGLYHYYYHLVATEDTYYPGNAHACRFGKPAASTAFWQMLLILPSRSGAARSPG